jgi:hypothetical protein
MFCQKCGGKIENERCTTCGSYQSAEYNSGYIDPYRQQNPYNYNQQLDTKNDTLILLLGMLSFAFGPILAIIALVLGKDFNKNNNYGNNKSIKIGKICAKLSIGLDVAAIIFIFLCYALLIGLAINDPSVLESFVEMPTEPIISVIHPVMLG